MGMELRGEGGAAGHRKERGDGDEGTHSRRREREIWGEESWTEQLTGVEKGGALRK